MATLTPIPIMDQNTGNLSQVRVPTKIMQTLYTRFLDSDRSFYQRVFNVYGTINTGEYLGVRNFGIQSKPAMWQARNLNNCCIDVMGGTIITSTDIETKPMVLAIKQCADAAFDSCFEGGQINPDTNKMKTGIGTLIRAMVDVAANMSGHALINPVTVGGLYDFTDATKPADVDRDDWLDAKTQLASNKGWLTALGEIGADCGVLATHLENLDLINSLDGDKLEGIFAGMYDKMGRKLRKYVNKKRAGNMPLFIVDEFTHSDVGSFISSVKSRGLTVVSNNIELTGNFTVREIEGTEVYYYRNIPIIPEEGINLLDDSIGYNTRSITLTLAGMIGFAIKSERNRDIRSAQPIGLAIQDNPSIMCHDVSMRADTRVGAGLADPDLILSSTTYQKAS